MGCKLDNGSNNYVVNFASVVILCFRQDDLKTGTLIGVDKYGNKYFENNYYFYGKDDDIYF